MKRQRSPPGSGESPVAKRSKGKDEVVVVEELERRHDSMAMVPENILVNWEDWSHCMWAVGDEQMSWGTSWCPFWDMEFISEALYGDVIWDEDIWGLQAIKEIPTAGL